MSAREDSAAQPRKAWLRALERTAGLEHEPLRTLPVVVDELAARFGAATALVSPQQRLSYAELAATAHRYSHWALARNLGAGDVVSLLMPSCPEYVAAWLGISRVGASVALLNTQLTGTLLAHSIRIVAPKHVIVHERLIQSLTGVDDSLLSGIALWVHGNGPARFRSLADELTRQPDGPPDELAFRPASIGDRALYIYTSGTTGLPKAANVSHLRVLQWSHWFAGLMDTRPEDRMYDCLPLYHGVGGVVAVGATLLGGGTVVLRERFLAQEFWRDVSSERCTLFQYVGELCRYLLKAAPHPLESRHELRLCCGNGLRGDVWDSFKSRFRIPRILEYYAATEGTFALYNCDGEPGAIGRIPAFLAHRLPVALVRFDVDRGAPYRNPDGFCERVPIGQVGEALGPQAGRFEGYADAEASAQKLLRDVFRPGDAWYRTGDLMRQDARGYYYFVDRIGDTYRWKGENVSSAEVAGVIASCQGVKDAAVYGVTVPHADGRAGMAAIVTDRDFDLARLYTEVAARLPDYARPVFLRLRAALELTPTFKPRTQELISEGFDPALAGDALYFDDRSAGRYVPLEATLYARLSSGAVRL